MEWNSLKAADKSRIIRTAVEHGITDLEEVKSLWRQSVEQPEMYDDGGILYDNGTQSPDNPPMGRANPDNWREYMDWAYAASERLSKEWDEPESFIFFDMLNGHDYDYKAFYDEDPQRAWDWLSSPEGSHFDDVGKTVYHPSFSNESMYSSNNYGDMGTGANPDNIEGPAWNDNNQLIDQEGNVVFDENVYDEGGIMDGPDNPPSKKQRPSPTNYINQAYKTLNNLGMSSETIDNDPVIKELIAKYALQQEVKQLQKDPEFVMKAFEATKKPFEKEIANTVNNNVYVPSDEILNYIKNTEKFKSEPYTDGNGKWTIGYGFTGELYDKYKNTGITRAQADKEFMNVVDSFAKMLPSATPNWNKLNQNQRDALFSYYYNIGHGNYTKKSPGMQKALQDMDWNEVANQMDFGYTDDKNKGLRIRRDYERALFLKKYGGKLYKKGKLFKIN